MAGQEDKLECKGYAMKGGDGAYSYAKNSSYQGSVIEASKELIKEAILEKLDISKFPPSNTFRVADLGCSVGPNTFFAVRNIIASLQLKYQNEDSNSQIPEFEVLFNDHPSNDFNTLFRSIPRDKMYFAYGVPGSFHSRLFPKAFLGFIHFSYALHRLSQVPNEVKEEQGAAWNKGRISYSYSAYQIVKAYYDQFLRDVEKFINEGAAEIAGGGLMVLIVPARPNGTPHSKSLHIVICEVLGSCLMELAKKGRVAQEKVNSFNLPIYIPSPEEMEVAINKNGRFIIKRMESLPALRLTNLSLTEIAKQSTLLVRAGLEEIIKEEFGEEILNEAFELHHQKFQEEFELLKTAKGTNLFVLLMRKPVD